MRPVPRRKAPEAIEKTAENTVNATLNQVEDVPRTDLVAAATTNTGFGVQFGDEFRHPLFSAPGTPGNFIAHRNPLSHQVIV